MSLLHLLVAAVAVLFGPLGVSALAEPAGSARTARCMWCVLVSYPTFLSMLLGLIWSVTHRCEVGCEEIYKYLFRSYAELEEDARAGKLGKIDEHNVAIKGGRRSVETKKKVQDTFNLHINSAWNESYSASFRSQLLDLLDFEDYKEALAVEMKGLGGTQSLKPAMVMPMPKQTSAMVRSALPRLGRHCD